MKRLLLIASQIPALAFLVESGGDIGLAFGYSALSCFILAALTSLRLPILERIFGGLDELYLTHHLMGRLTVVFTVLHLVLMSSYPVEYLLTDSSILAGWFSLILIVLVIFLARFLDRSHKLWRAFHLISFPSYVLAFYHFYSLTTLEGVYRLGLIVLFAIGLISMLLSVFKVFSKKYVVEKVTHLSDRVVSLKLKPLKSPIVFKPSQFLFASFEPSKDYQACCEFHPFTITSLPQDEFIEVIVKARGDCSCRIQNIKEGVHARLDGPHGGFNIKPGAQIWVGGGVGVTPFISLLSETKSNVDLYYVAKKQEDLVLLSRLKEAARDGVTIYPVLIDENAHELLSKIKEKGLDSKQFIISGPPSMVKALEGLLIKEGVPAYNIQHETCGFRGFVSG